MPRSRADHWIADAILQTGGMSRVRIEPALLLCNRASHSLPVVDGTTNEEYFYTHLDQIGAWKDGTDQRRRAVFA